MEPEIHGLREKSASKEKKIIQIDKRITTKAKRVIDAKGLIVAPGFIDAHTHSDAALLMNRNALNYNDLMKYTPERF